MKVEFTPAQQAVIDARGCNVLVSAAAGSGKTAVLVERIIQKICNKEHPVDIDKLLVVTFTEAAAAQMKERIRQAISKRLAEHPEGEEADNLERQAALLHNAQINTIDGFCFYLIKNHFHEIGLEPAMRVADPGEIKLLKQDVLAQLLEDKFAQKDPAFLNCVEFFCPNGYEKNLEEYILDLHQFAESNPWPVEWLTQRKADYAPMTPDQWTESPLGQYQMSYCRTILADAVRVCEKLLKICEEPDGPYMYGDMLENDLQLIGGLAKLSTVSAMEEALPLVKFKTLSPKKDDSVSADKREYVKAERDSVKKSVTQIREKLFKIPIEQSLKQMEKCEQPVAQLIDLVIDFRQRFQDKKLERKMIDFSDMEHYALDILLTRRDGEIQASEVAREYRNYFEEVMIDEYQDSNLVQEYLLKAVSGEEDGHYNRFMVGDVKQSIYKFRLARPELFLEKYNSYDSAPEARIRRIDLSKNFRSRKEVLDTVNDIFGSIMEQDKGGILYDDAAALHLGAKYPEWGKEPSELLLIEKPGEEDDLSVKQTEAKAIAQRIKRLCRESYVTDDATKQLRRPTYRDMVILLRTNSGWDEEFKEVLEAEGIPVHIESKSGYFEAREVQDLLLLLRVLDNPLQDIPLFGVMKSVLGGFTQEEIALLRTGDRKKTLWESLLAAMAEGQEILQEKCTAFAERIRYYRECSTYMAIRELLETIIRDYHYIEYVAAMPGGSKRKANVEMLLQKASVFEGTSYFGLFHFVRYMEQLEKYDVDYGEAGTLDENADVVRILSIHKSKGLEFPITFVAGLNKNMNMMDTRNAILRDMELGLAVDRVDVEARVKERTLRKNLMAIRLKAEILAEEMRILYVALTRPKEKLIMTAVLENAEEKWEAVRTGARGSMSFLQFMNVGSSLDFILPVVHEEITRVDIVSGVDMTQADQAEQIDLALRSQSLLEADDQADQATVDQLLQRFNYDYPFENLRNLYTKTSVSELKIAAMEEKDEAAYQTFEEKEVMPYLPAFRREEQEPGGAERGNAYHKIMEVVDYSRIYEGIDLSEGAFWEENEADTARLLENLEGELDRAVADRRLSKLHRGLLNMRKLMRFFTDSLAIRMYAADRRGELYREQPFVMGISARRLGEEFPEQEKVLIQGIIDAFFIEDGNIVLVDYKTDRIGSPRELWDRYEEQVKYYSEALTKLMDLPVSQQILYSYGLEQRVSFPVSER